eukprot:3715687-Pyramimonas_sp.AAC.1
MGRFLLLESLLGRLLVASWGVLGASVTVSRQSWASWSNLSATRSPLGLSGGPFGVLLARFGAPWGSKGAAGTFASPPPPNRPDWAPGGW